ncbi:MAG TPA: hypothetical protein VFS15_19535 [Kofleriaceae bacterium]|nr:hypothetical protein [Kofleriaceae bacterium]
MSVLLLLTAPASADDARTVDVRRAFVRLDAGLGSPEGYYGGAVGFTVHPALTVEAGVGSGETGLQLALLARHYDVVHAPDQYLTFAAGPSLALLNRSLVGDWPSRPDMPDGRPGTFYLAGMNVEVGSEVRRAWGGMFRASVGLFVKLAENITQLCDGAPPGGDCNPPMVDNSFSVHAAKVASWSVFPYASIGVGFAF